jgi:DNA mismatch repair protein MutS2
VLLDEVGQGTDPVEAAAIAQAVLERVLREEALILTTTHLAPLKAYATRAPGVQNASVDLDAEGRPTFLLTVGRAGRSFALEVARASGLPDDICDRAEALHAGKA